VKGQETHLWTCRWCIMIIILFVHCMTTMLLDCAMQCIVTAADAFSLSARVGLRSNMGGRVAFA